jgi:membrane protein
VASQVSCDNRIAWIDGFDKVGMMHSDGPSPSSIDNVADMIKMLCKAVDRFILDDCTTLAAGLAFYTLFAMPPLLFLLVSVVSLGMSLWYEQAGADVRAREFLEQQAAQVMGNQAAGREIGSIIQNTGQQVGTWWKSLLSLLGVVVGATGLVAVLPSSLNRVWRVKPQEGAFAKTFLWKRLLSLAMILAFGFLLLVSFVISTLLTIFTDYMSQWLGIEGNLPSIINQLVSFATTWVFYAAVFRWMPDAVISWRDAILGSMFTVILFSLGRWALFAYLPYGKPGQELGSAAGSLVIILLWVYYSSIVLLFGAEFTAALSPVPAAAEPGAEQVPAN